MPATTEVAVIVLKPGIDIEAEPAAGIIRELGETLQQQDGYQQMHTGIWIENPQSMQFFISKSSTTRQLICSLSPIGTSELMIYQPRSTHFKG